MNHSSAFNRSEVIVNAKVVGGLQVVEGAYGNEHAWQVVAAAIDDYEDAVCR